MKRINQFERTDRDITNALLGLMDKRSFEKITIQDILEEALINRSTFYQHFPDKYAILERLQDRFMQGIVEHVETILTDGQPDLVKVNAAMLGYFADKTDELKKLYSVRSETLDLEGRMRTLMKEYLLKSSDTLSPLSAEILSGVMLRYLLDKLQSGGEFSEMSTEMLQIWMEMSLYFFRLDHVPDAKTRLLETVKALHGIE